METRPRPGRPREFDVDQALDAALEVFWRQGYEGTAISDLTTAMGINRPSLYGTYGNKAALFEKVMERYAEQVTGYLAAALELPTSREVVRALLVGVAENTTRPGRPRGCLSVQGALASSPAADGIRTGLNARRAGLENALRRRLAYSVAEHDLPAAADPALLAKYVNTVFQGLAVQAAGGASRPDLLAVIDVVLATWPEPHRH